MKEPTFVAKIFDVFATKTLASLFGLKECMVVEWGRSDMHDSNLFSIFYETLKLTPNCALDRWYRMTHISIQCCSDVEPQVLLECTFIK